MPQPANAADRIRAILADPAGQKDPNMQQIWLDEMAMIIDIIDRLGVMQRGPLAGVMNGQAMIGKILGEVKDEIITRLDTLIIVANSAQMSPPVGETAATIAELKDGILALVPTTPEVITEASASVTRAVLTVERAMPFLLSANHLHPAWVALDAAITTLQKEIGQ